MISKVSLLIVHAFVYCDAVILHVSRLSLCARTQRPADSCEARAGAEAKGNEDVNTVCVCVHVMMIVK